MFYSANRTNRNPSGGKGTRLVRGASIVLRCAFAVCVFALAGCRGIVASMYRRSLERGGYMESWTSDEGRILSGLSYGEGDVRRYDLYLHGSVDPNTEAPLLLLIHGGSWTDGSRGDMAYACKYYGRQGCITASMDYSLISEDRPDVTVGTMLDEITACTAALKKQLAAEGYRVSGLAIGGFSAGAHLAMLYAYSRAEQSAIPIAFVFEKVGPVSFRRDFWDDRIASVLIGYGARIQVDRDNLDDPEVVAAANSLSPLHFVKDGAPPTVFAYGGEDTLVRPVHRDELAKALEEHHVPNRRVDFPNSNHMLWDDADSTEEFRKAVLDYCRQYLKLPADRKSTGSSAFPSAESGTDMQPSEKR